MILCLLLSLQMKVDGRNLLSVCKLAFKICRNKENDSIVQNDTLLGMYSVLVCKLDVEIQQLKCSSLKKHFQT